MRKESEVKKAERALEWAQTKESRAYNALRNKKIKWFKAAATKARLWSRNRVIQ